MAVRLTGGDDITPEVREFMSRYGVRGYPTLYVMNADGHVVVPKVSRTVDAMLQALAGGETAEKDFAAEKAKSSAEGRKAFTALLKMRMAWDDLAEIQAGELKASPSADGYSELVRTYASAGRPADERATLEAALKAFPDAKEKATWRMRLATMDVDPSRAASREEGEKLVEKSLSALTDLAAKFESDKDVSGAAQVHGVIGGLLLRSKKPDDAEQHFDAALAGDPKGTGASAWMMGKANCSWVRNDYAGCKKVLEKLIADYPDSDEAKAAPRGIENCDRKLGGGKK